MMTNVVPFNRELSAALTVAIHEPGKGWVRATWEEVQRASKDTIRPRLVERGYRLAYRFDTLTREVLQEQRNRYEEDILVYASQYHGLRGPICFELLSLDHIEAHLKTWMHFRLDGKFPKNARERSPEFYLARIISRDYTSGHYLTRREAEHLMHHPAARVEHRPASKEHDAYTRILVHQVEAEGWGKKGKEPAFFMARTIGETIERKDAQYRITYTYQGQQRWSGLKTNISTGEQWIMEDNRTQQWVPVSSVDSAME